MSYKKITGSDLGEYPIFRCCLKDDDELICPFCHKSIATLPIYSLFIDKENLQVFLKCLSCKNSFIGYCSLDSKKDDYRYFHIKNLSIGKPKLKEFHEKIKELSNEFVEIYGQSEFAENQKLDKICGVGYRKALEFLIKDFAKKKSPDKIENIEKESLASCIDNYIDDEKIKDISKRAVWLGNDQTHYTKIWEDKDIKHLKQLIDLVVHFIVSDIESEELLKEMPESNKNKTSPKNK